ncbi:MAG: GTP cyclohydrolase I FolE [Imperialibacter sp.]|uniref:GTP cyclohydrolase I FolE n=1 Tax=unclassified Imperialibacter TaxID=2629706 RepID=UPI0012517979|nr:MULTISPECIES: GTP cyclohydrolase I FolE [unclassified Imperialibacter]CAD5250714.1 GTP cyclohydrolase I [Imperialibacter sp. 75]CAD5285956.1 GTP cyclohydrolase I [Imperialibacter sp. 89]VVT05144.1 GTP cyclohydrolase I [Imperialibacter sp. EC-SDR9]
MERIELLEIKHLSPCLNDEKRLGDDEKVVIIARHFKSIMETLGLDVNDDSLKATPVRVAKMYVKEVFSGLNPINKPSISLFENTYGYNEMLVEKDITLYSYCEHHFVPIIGKVHVAYIPAAKVIGLSKINRLTQYYSRRPQVQERLTREISEGLREALQTQDVAVCIEAAHLCVASRGVEDTKSSTRTVMYSGRFQEAGMKLEFLSALR